MTKRKLMTGLATAGVFSAGFGAAVLPAHAEQRSLTVTLLGGKTVQVVIDVPPGTPLDQVTVPGITTPIVAIEDHGAVTPPAPAPETAPQPEPKPDPAPEPGPAPQPDPAPAAPASATPAPAAPAPSPPAAPAPSAPSAPSASPGAEVQRDEPAEPEDDGRSSRKPARKDDDGARKRAARDRPDRPAPAAAPAAPASPPAGGGVPTPQNPDFSLAVPGAAPVGVPNFFIDKFRIPPFLLPIYQAAGIEYGVRWEILAAINEIETDYGRNLNVSSAGALGWMQFMPATWKAYGVDANDDGTKDPFNPVDAIFAAARYLKAANADTDIRAAIFAYNHANWYVDSVLMRARLIGGLPTDLVGSLSGLTQGHFPVHATARYAGAVSVKDARRRTARGANAARPVESASDRRGIDIHAKAGSPAIAVQDGRVVRIGTSKRLGSFVQLRDVYGNTYTYAHLKKTATAYPVPKERSVSRDDVAKELALPKRDPKPTTPASAGRQGPRVTRKAPAVRAPAPDAGAAAAADRPGKERLFAEPERPMAFKHGGQEQVLNAETDATTFKSYFTDPYGLDRDDVTIKPLEEGSKVIAGTILGRIGKTSADRAPHLRFEIRPAGKDAPRIDPKPILDGWKLLESTSVYRAKGKNPFFGPDARNASVGQILLMGKEALQRRVLRNPRVEMYGCGARDIKAGIIDRRVLATIEFLAASGLRPTVSSLKCGHSYYSKSGNVSHHTTGTALDIAAINGVPIMGHQGPGSVTDITIRRLLTLQGTMKPDQIISLMRFDGADNTISMPDHADHIHVGFRPVSGTREGGKLDAVLKPSQWTKLIDRLGEIENPEVLTQPSKYALKVSGASRASRAHEGE